MRNRSTTLSRTLLAAASGVIMPSLLAGQVMAHALSDAGMRRAGPGGYVLPASALNSAAMPASPEAPAVVRWYHGLLFVGAIAALSPADETIRHEVQKQRSSGSDDVAKAIRHVGQPEVYATVALGTMAAGLVSGNDKVLRAGARITSGIALGGAVTALIKLGVGRRRPFSSEDQYTFGPFSKVDASFPSGHTMTAFALATGISDELHSLPVTIGMYTLATGVGWSRMNDNKHWLTDVVAGAAIGITSVKLMNGRWRVFGISAPHVLLEPRGGAALGWSGKF